jgi:hypothetical protein
VDRAHSLERYGGTDFSAFSDEALYRNWDRRHPNRERIEAELAEREKTRFHLDETLYLYDLTSTYFEGEAASNPQAKRGYSRDKRPAAQQVLVGLVLDRDGFPKAHESFEGNRPPGPDGRRDLAHLHFADAGGSGLPGDEEPAGRTAYLSSARASYPNAYLP